MCKILHDGVRAINVEFRLQIQRPIGNHYVDVMNAFNATIVFLV